MKKINYKIKMCALLAGVMLAGASNAYASEVSGTVSTGLGNSSVNGIVISAPVASPVAGTYTSAQSVTLASSGSLSVRYTTDGTSPTCSTGTAYSGTISVPSTQTINAISCYANSVASTVASFAYTINIPAPAPASSGGGGPVWSYTPPAATPAVPATQIEGCKPGNLFSTTTGKSCTVSATPATSDSTKAKAKGEVLGATVFNFTRGLALGSRGDEVTKLQERLIREGFLSGTTTGYFGKLTREAVKKFQAKNGITTTGTVGPKTRAALNK